MLKHTMRKYKIVNYVDKDEEALENNTCQVAEDLYSGL